MRYKKSWIWNSRIRINKQIKGHKQTFRNRSSNCIRRIHKNRTSDSNQGWTKCVHTSGHYRQYHTVIRWFGFTVQARLGREAVRGYLTNRFNPSRNSIQFLLECTFQSVYILSIMQIKFLKYLTFILMSRTYIAFFLWNMQKSQTRKPLNVKGQNRTI